jgi:hypothetical protein
MSVSGFSQLNEGEHPESEHEGQFVMVVNKYRLGGSNKSF